MIGTRRLLAIGVAFTVVAAACSSSDPPTMASDTTTSGSPFDGSVPAVAPPAPPPIVPLLRLNSAADVSYGQKFLMTSQVLAAEPVSALELWVDGTMVDEHKFEGPITDPTFAWEWTADSVGLHAAIVRAIDANGRAAGSFPTWFRVDSGWNIATGEPLDGLPRSPLEEAAAGVSTDTTACEATIAIHAAPDADGQAVTGSTLGTGGFRAIAVVGAAGGSLAIPMLSTPLIVSVEPYGDGSPRSPTTVIIPGAPDCATGSWAGDIAFEGSVLVGGEDLEVAYLYARSDTAIWQRVPESGFIPRGAGGFDFDGLLPTVAPGESLEVEVWGWRHGQAVGLGRGRYQETATQPTSEVWAGAQPVKPFSSLNIVRFIAILDTSAFTEQLLTDDVVCAAGVFNPICGVPTPTVRWNTGYLGAEAGLVQVSTSAPPAGAALDYPGLLWSTMIAMDGEQQRDVVVPLQEINSSDWLASGSTRAGPTRYRDLEAIGAELSVVTELAPPGASPRTSRPILGSRVLGVDLDRLWVRVIPFTNGLPIEGVSNSVSFRVEGESLVIEPSLQQAFDAAFDIEVEFAPPQHPDTAFAHCVRVVENPFGNQNPVPEGSVWDTPVIDWQFAFNGFRDSATVYSHGGNSKVGLVPGATVCAYKPDPPDKGLFDYIGEGISFIGQAWDTFKGLVDMVKSGIIEGIVDITGCSPKDVCLGALAVLGDIGLATLGVPPSLPSFSELAEAAKGDIAAALAKELVGQACGSIPCDEFAEKFIEDAFDDIEAHFSDLAVSQATSGGWVLQLHPDIRVVPEPAGQLFPGSAMITITRKTDGFALGSVPVTGCVVSLETDGAGPLSWTAKNGIHHEGEFVSGNVFPLETVFVDLSQLEPGESVTVGIASLEFESISHLKGTSPFDGGFVSQERLISKGLWSGPQTTFTMNLSVCGKGFSESSTKDATPASPADIPTP